MSKEHDAVFGKQENELSRDDFIQFLHDRVPSRAIFRFMVGIEQQGQTQALKTTRTNYDLVVVGSWNQKFLRPAEEAVYEIVDVKRELLDEPNRRLIEQGRKDQH